MMGFYKHVNSMDMVIEVLNSSTTDPKFVRIRFRCWTQNYNGDIMLATSKIFTSKIEAEHVSNWGKYDA